MPFVTSSVLVPSNTLKAKPIYSWTWLPELEPFQLRAGPLLDLRMFHAFDTVSLWARVLAARSSRLRSPRDSDKLHRYNALVAQGLGTSRQKDATRSKDATRGSWHRY